MFYYIYFSCGCIIVGVLGKCIATWEEKRRRARNGTIPPENTSTLEARLKGDGMIYHIMDNRIRWVYDLRQYTGMNF